MSPEIIENVYLIAIVRIVLLASTTMDSSSADMPSIGDPIEVYRPRKKAYVCGKVIGYNHETQVCTIDFKNHKKLDIYLPEADWKLVKCLNKESESQVAQISAKPNQDTKRMKVVNKDGISKKNSSAPVRRSLRIALQESLCESELPEPIPRHAGTVEKFMGRALENYMHYKYHRENRFHVSAKACLRHARNVIGSVLPSGIPEFSEKWASTTDRNFDWVLTGNYEDSKRARYQTWKIPPSDEEWVKLKKMAEKISMCIVEAMEKVQRVDDPLVDAMGVLQCAMVLCCNEE